MNKGISDVHDLFYSKKSSQPTFMQKYIKARFSFLFAINLFLFNLLFRLSETDIKLRIQGKEKRNKENEREKTTHNENTDNKTNTENM